MRKVEFHLEDYMIIGALVGTTLFPHGHSQTDLLPVLPLRHFSLYDFGFVLRSAMSPEFSNFSEAVVDGGYGHHVVDLTADQMERTLKVTSNHSDRTISSSS